MEIQLAKFLIRTGTEAQRVSADLGLGEPGYTSDTQRLFVGDGSTPGGIVINSKVHSILLSDTKTSLQAYTNDIVYCENRLWQLSGTNYTQASAWVFIGTKTDDSTVEYNGNYKLTVKDGGINSSHVSTSIVTGCLSGGEGNPLYINLQPYFSITNGMLGISALSAGNMDSNTFGSGLTYNSTVNKLSANLASVDSTIMYLSSNGEIGLHSTITATPSSAVYVVKLDKAGKATQASNTVVTLLSGANGSYGGKFQTPYSTTYVAVSSNSTDTATENLTLSSAGFMLMDFGHDSQGTPLTRIAIPIFKY